MLSRLMYMFVIGLPIVVTVLWHVLDANPTLFVYDLAIGNRRYNAFQNKTIWVTGASSGIGAEIVCELVKAQAAQVILSARRVEKLQQVANQCQQQQQQQDDSSHSSRTKLSILPYDATQLDRVSEIVNSALALTSNHSIDVLILNAGVYQLKPALQTSLDETLFLHKVNYIAPVALTTTLIHTNQWKDRGYGHVVVVTSLVARGAQSLTSSYAASKAALRNYMVTLSTEEADWLQVHLALPGATDTELWDFLNTTTATATTTTSDVAKKSSKMTAARVAQLILTGASGRPYWLFYETFISKPIGLVWVYLSMYTPTLFHWMIHVVGYLRVQMWNKYNCDTLDVITLLSSGMDFLLGRL